MGPLPECQKKALVRKLLWEKQKIADITLLDNMYINYCLIKAFKAL